MKQRVLIKFMQATNVQTLSSKTLAWARNIADVLITRNEMLTSDFVFHFGSLTDLRDPNYIVLDVYVAAVSIERPLDPGEKLICACLQEIIKNEKTLDGIKEVIGYVIEYYRVIQKKRAYSPQLVTHRANLYINGTKFTHDKKEEIDIGIDRLDGDGALEMCECTTFVDAFREHKSGQILFYANAFRKIRSILDPRVKLTMELVAGYTTRKHRFSDIPLPEEFIQSKIQVKGVSLATGNVVLLHNPPSM